MCTGGELFDMLVKKGNFAENEGAVIIKRVLNAINYCHIRGIVHRDLKPENILLDGDNKSNYSNIKLVDFGTAVKYNTKKMTSLTGTSFYIAPEVVAAGLEGGSAYSNKCDVWSIGVITFILLSGKMPFYGKNNDAIFAMGK
jgi:serine/threonine protein kinase